MVAMIGLKEENGVNSVLWKMEEHRVNDIALNLKPARKQRE